jgi:hypothetical protein
MIFFYKARASIEQSDNLKLAIKPNFGYPNMETADAYQIPLLRQLEEMLCLIQ